MTSASRSCASRLWRQVRAEEFDEALALYDEALGSRPTTKKLRELITINKADALIALERERSRSEGAPDDPHAPPQPASRFLAAYALMYTHRSRTS